MQIWDFFQGIHTLFLVDPSLAFARIFLIILGFVFIYFGYKGTLEPLLMVPMGIAMVSVNAGLMVFEAGNIGTLFVHPLSNNLEELMNYLQIDFLQPVYTFMFSNGLIACLVFMGIGAITEIDYLIAQPFSSLFLAVFAEFGTIFTLPIAMAWGLTAKESAAISLVGGADGPMVLFGSLMMAKNLFVPITVVAYLYLSVCYAGYPLLARLVPKKLRGIEMNWRDVPRVSKSAKFGFSVIICGILCLLFPVAAPLFASFFVGLAVKEAGITRYIEFISGPVLYGSTFFLAFTLGSLLGADIIMDPVVLKLLVLGMLALTLSGLGGLAGGLIYHKISKKPFNPLIGLAAVSCVPSTAKVVQKCAYQANKKCMILPFAMGPNVAGVITTAIVTGIYISGIKFLG
jgi:oxaloacetate decarboxylase beta subunit